MIRDFTDDEARRALPYKWGAVAADVIPAWVAEMDYALAPPVAEALAEAVDAGHDRLPRRWRPAASSARRTPGSRARHYGQDVDPAACCRWWT